jgi:hypothetical protein
MPVDYGNGLAVRLVSGFPHLFSTYSTSGNLYEMSPPSDFFTNSSKYQTAPWANATLIEDWSTKGSQFTVGGYLYGLYWDPNTSRLYTTSGTGAIDYTTTDMASLGFFDFTQSTPPYYGSWSYANGWNFKMADYGLVGVPSDFQTQYSVGNLAAGFGGYRSLMAQGCPASLGPSLTTFSTPAIGTTGTPLANTPLVGYPATGSSYVLRPDTQIVDAWWNSESSSVCSNGSVPSMGCPYDPTGDVAEYQGYSITSSTRSAYPTSSTACCSDITTGNSVTISSKSSTPGTSYSTADFWHGAAWIQTTNKEGLVVLGDLATGRVQYINSTVKFGDGIEHDWFIYSRAQLASVVPTSKGGGGASMSSIQPTTYYVTFPYGSTYDGTVFPTLPQTVQNAAPTSFLGTVSESMTIGTGSITFTTQSGLAYSVGNWVTLFAPDLNSGMEGFVTAYSGTRMTVNVQATSGSGTYSSWWLTGASGHSDYLPHCTGMAYDSVNQYLYVQMNNASCGPENCDPVVYVYYVNDTASAQNTLTVTQGANGTISPGTTAVASGSSQTFSITPNSGYQITSVTVDGTSVGTATSYTFSDVTANHTITASFSAVTQYTITATSGSYGSISPSGSVLVNGGANQTFTITANTGYAVASVLIDNVSIGASGSYTFSSVSANHTISATFAPITYTITPTAGANGAISPSTAVTVDYGASQSFTITPAAGFLVSSVLVDGASVGAVTSYTFSTVTASHTIAASFSVPVTQYSITSSAGSNGTISPSGSVLVNSGNTQAFTVTPSSGYTASVGGTCGGSLSGTTYTTNAISSNCTVTAAFTQQASNSLIQSSGITYLGAFTVPNAWVSSSQTTQYGGQAIGFNPNGNGGAGSLLIEGLSGQNSSGLYVAEISIPSNANLYTGSSTTGFTSSSTASFVSPNSSSPYLWDISQGNYTKVGSGGANESSNCANGWGLGGLYVNSSGTVYATSFCFYDELEEASGAEGAGLSVLPLFTHTDTTSSPLSSSTYSGMYGLNIGSNFPGNTGDLTSGALASIPSAYQSQLGGTMLVGANPKGMSQISRTSDGPALTAFNPANFGAANTFANASALVSYPENHQTLGTWGSVVTQYTSEADAFSAIAVPPNSGSVLVMGTHGVGGPGLACPAMPTSGVNCYGEYTANCGEVCMASPPSGSGIPTCGSQNSTCGGYSRGTWDCCYDPVGLATNAGGHGNTAWPYVSYVWAYDVGSSSGSNSPGNNTASMPSTAPGYTGVTTRNNLTAVKLGYVNPWDLYPYATWELNDPFNALANQAQSGNLTAGTYDPVSGKLYVSLPGGQPSTTLPIVEVYQISPPTGTQHTITASAGSNGSISPSGSVQISSGNTQQFVVTPGSGYSASVGGTCGGTLSSNTYTTSSITANCTVTATFTLIPPPGAPYLE